MKWVYEYIGLPYKLNGRDRGGIDCWGLVWLVLAEQFGVDLPSLQGQYDDAGDHGGISRLIDETRVLVDAVQVDYPADGDIVVLRYMGYTTHVGVVAGPYVLHITGMKWSIIQRLDSAHIAHRIEGYYRVG